MNQDILDAIKKSLPSLQVEALKVELDKAAKLDAALAGLKASGDENRRLVDENMVLKRNAQRLEDIEDKEYKYELEKLKHELAVEKTRHADLKYLIEQVFRNPVIMKYGSAVAPGGNQYGPSTMPVSETIETK